MYSSKHFAKKACWSYSFLMYLSIIGITVAPPTKEIKHGIALERHTKKKYVSEFKRTHLNFNCKDIGLVLFKQYPNLGASLDLIVECRCCGKVLLKLNVLVLLLVKNLHMKIFPTWKLQRKVTTDLKKTVRIFIKCTAKWQQLNQSTVIFLYTQNIDFMWRG